MKSIQSQNNYKILQMQNLQENLEHLKFMERIT